MAEEQLALLEASLPVPPPLAMRDTLQWGRTTAASLISTDGAATTGEKNVDMGADAQPSRRFDVPRLLKRGRHSTP